VLLTALAGCSSQPAVETAAQQPPPPAIDPGDERGACIGATARYETCAYSIAVFGPEDAPRSIVSRKLASTSDDGQVVWEELDRLQPPALPRGTTLEFGSCRHGQAADDTILAVVPPHDETSPEYIGAAGWAYRVELPSGHFAALDAGAVDCFNSAIGAD
jgi:hypothetical protein